MTELKGLIYPSWMRRCVMVALSIAACGRGQTSGSSASAPRSHKQASQLDDVQIECRSSEMLDLGRIDAAFGPTCAKQPTLPLSLDYFDLGTHDGLTEALSWSYAQTWLCVCAETKCPEDVSLKVMDRARKVMVEDQGKREREGVLRITNMLASHSCLSAVAGSEIYKLGFRCGFTTGLKSQVVEQERIKTFLTIENGDEVQARVRARACASQQ